MNNNDNFPTGFTTTVDYKGFTIKKWICGYAYPKNGNTHNPTPQVMWKLEGHGMFHALNKVKTYIDELAA